MIYNAVLIVIIDRILCLEMTRVRNKFHKGASTLIFDTLDKMISKMLTHLKCKSE